MKKDEVKKKVAGVIKAFLGEKDSDGAYEPVYFDDYDVELLSDAISDVLTKE